MKLKRTGQPGYWRSADGRWLFVRMELSRSWHVYHADDEEEATYQKFGTLWEAVAWAEKYHAS